MQKDAAVRIDTPQLAPSKTELAMHEAANSKFFKPFWLKAGTFIHRRRLDLAMPRETLCEALPELGIDGFDGDSLEALERFGYDVGTFILFAICEVLNLDPVDIAEDENF